MALTHKQILNFHNFLIKLFFLIAFEYHKKKLPKDCNIVIINTWGCKYQEYSIEAEDNVGLAMFLPQMPHSKIDVKVYSLTSNMINYAIEGKKVDLAKKFVDNLITKDDDHNCILMFSNQDFGSAGIEDATERFLIKELENR